MEHGAPVHRPRAPAMEHGTTPVQKTMFPCYLNWLYQSPDMSFFPPVDR